MARIEGNDLTLGLRGKFGKQFVFRKYKSRTIASRKGAPSGVATQKQIDHRERFRVASLYARRAMSNPELKAEYELIADATESTAIAVALMDYMKPILISGILTATYAGEIGFPLTITVNDVFKVKTMKVTLINASGTVIETGLAVLSQASLNYAYTTTVAIPDISGVKIKVEASDRPGQIAVHEVTL
jgi:hypothetical protein